MTPSQDVAFEIEALFHQDHYAPDYRRIMAIVEKDRTEVIESVITSMRLNCSLFNDGHIMCTEFESAITAIRSLI